MGAIYDLVVWQAGLRDTDMDMLHIIAHTMRMNVAATDAGSRVSLSVSDTAVLSTPGNQCCRGWPHARLSGEWLFAYRAVCQPPGMGFKSICLDCSVVTADRMMWALPVLPQTCMTAAAFDLLFLTMLR